MNRQQAVNFLKILKYDFEQNALKAEKEIKKHMGYDSEGLAKVIYWYENKEKKMTREEALKVLNDAKWSDAGRFLNTLEALGLIKFDEPPKRKYIFFPNPDAGKDNISVYQDDAIKTLNEYGYDVIKRK